MALPEPDNPLYAAVKAIANPWPPDDEDVAQQLAQAWTTAGKAAQQVGTQQATTGLAGKASAYAQTLTQVKQAITQAVNQALPAYVQAGNPLITNGAQVRQQIVTQLAAKLTALVQNAAGQLRGGDPPGAKPAGDQPESKTDEALDIASKGFNLVSAAAGVLALIPPLTPVAAPIAALTGGAGLVVDSIKAARAGGKNAMDDIGVASDVAGLVPGVKSVAAIGKGVEEASNLAKVGAVTNLAGTTVGLPPNQTAEDNGTVISAAGNAISLRDALRSVK
jgi:hypothetical protein